MFDNPWWPLVTYRGWWTLVIFGVFQINCYKMYIQLLSYVYTFNQMYRFTFIDILRHLVTFDLVWCPLTASGEIWLLLAAILASAHICMSKILSSMKLTFSELWWVLVSFGEFWWLLVPLLNFGDIWWNCDLYWTFRLLVTFNDIW